MVGGGIGGQASGAVARRRRATLLVLLSYDIIFNYGMSVLHSFCIMNYNGHVYEKINMNQCKTARCVPLRLHLPS